MNNLIHELLNPPSYVVSEDIYEDLCMVRDKLLLMAQLTGTATSNGDHDTSLLIRRGLIWQLFSDLSFQVNNVLAAMEQAKTYVERAPTH